MKADAAIVHDEQVARMGIPVEQPHHKELMQIGLDENARQPGAVFPHGRIVHPPAVTVRLDQDRRGGEFLVHGRNIDGVPVGEGLAKTLHGAGLEAEVHFLPQARLCLVQQRQQPVAPQERQHPLQAAHGHAQQAHVLRHLNENPRSSNLDDYIGTVPEPGPVNLGNGRRCHRFRIELGKQRIRRRTQLLLDSRHRLRPRKGRHAILKTLQRTDVGFRQQITAQPDGLAEFDKGGSQILQHPAQPLGRRLRRMQQMQPDQQQPAGKAPQGDTDTKKPDHDHDDPAGFSGSGQTTRGV